jgi:PleD family two-component response regulator
MKADPTLSHVPIMFVTSHVDHEFESVGLKLGADDYITKPIVESSLIARVTARLRTKAAADESRRRVTLDGVTRLPNHRAFKEALDCEWRRGVRGRRPISQLLLTLDYFKGFSARYGRAASEGCLQAVAGCMARAGVRPADLVARLDTLGDVPGRGVSFLARGAL